MLIDNSYPRIYADDTHLTHADKDVNTSQSCLNEDLVNISKWLIANKLTLKVSVNENFSTLLDFVFFGFLA